MLLAAFVGFAIAAALVTIFVGASDDVDTTVGWIFLGVLGLLQLVALVALRPLWFTKTTGNIVGTVMTGVFMRLAIGETLFLVALVLVFAGMATIAMLLVALIGSIVLVWLFAAPTGSNIALLQDQLERTGSFGDVATELAAPRSAMERPPR